MALACLIFIPPILIIIFSIILAPVFQSNSFIDPFSIAIVDYDNSIGSRIASESLKQEGYISKLVEIKLVEEQKGLELIKQGKIAGMLVIPDGFSGSLQNGTNKPIRVYTNSKLGINSEMVKSFFKGAGNLVIAGQSGIYTIYHYFTKIGISNNEAIEKAKGHWLDFILLAIGRNEIFEKEVISDIPQIDPIHYYIVGISVMFIMFTGVVGIRLITQDYETGILARILISPMNRFNYIFGKLITIAFLGILEFISIIITISTIVKTDFLFMNLSLLLIVLSVILASSALCILISIWTRTSAKATISSIITIFILSLAGGCIYPVASMTDSLKIISNFTISKWAIKGIALAMTGGDIKIILNICGIMMLFALTFLLVSVITIKRRELRFF